MQKLFSVSGCSFHNGFDLTLYLFRSEAEWLLECRAPEGEYPKEERTDWFAVAWMIIGIVIASYYHIWILVFTLLMISRHDHTFYVRFKTWHWCEHQLAMILESGRTPTHELLRHQTPVLARCGSVAATGSMLLIATPLASGMHGYYHEWAGMVLSALFGISALWVVLSHTVLLQYIKGGTTIKCMSLPALGVCLAFERLFFLRRPSARQTARVLVWAREAALSVADILIREAATYDRKTFHPPASP